MLSPGQVLQGQKSGYRLIQRMVTRKHIQSTIWTATILNSGSPPRTAIVKTAPWDRYEWLKRERDAYNEPSIGNSPYIRHMYDEIHPLSHQREFASKEALEKTAEEKPWCLVFEYLTHTLDELDASIYKKNLAFVAAYFTGTLTALLDIGRTESIWTDGKAENILCSDVDSSNPIVKIADLGLVGPTGFDREQLQSKKTRAPEVWAGRPCTHVADIWSIAATFVSWVDHEVFGPPHFEEDILILLEDAWCIAKIIRGFETAEDPMPPPPPDAKKTVKKLHDLGRQLLTQKDDGTPGSMHIAARPFFAEILPRLGLAPEVGDLLRKILVLDPNKRLTAEELLKSKEYKALLAAAAKQSAVNVSSGENTSNITTQVANIKLD